MTNEQAQAANRAAALQHESPEDAYQRGYDNGRTSRQWEVDREAGECVRLVEAARSVVPKEVLARGA